MSVLGELEDILEKERNLILSARFEDLERLATRKSLLAGRIGRKKQSGHKPRRKAARGGDPQRRTTAIGRAGTEICCPADRGRTIAWRSDDLCGGRKPKPDFAARRKTSSASLEFVENFR